ncbi:MAG: alpha/beta fold hydrolase [Myxococcales bacterium]|nr:alpha/beta fold hydrolase [Myxococcales bacterium]
MTDRHPVLAGAEPWSAEGTGARGAVGVVVSHGLTGNPISTRPLGEALAAAGFSVSVVRLPGHGTAWRDMAPTRYADWRAEVERAIDALRRAGKKVVVVGLSMGGTLALDLACARPDAVAGAVSINPAVLDREGLLARAAPVLEKIIPVVPAGAAGLVKNDIAKGGDEKAYAYVPVKAANSLLRELPRIRAALAELRVPLLVCYSPQDHSVPPRNSRALIEMLAGKDVTELRLERSYHVATLDHDFDLLVERVCAFCDRVAGPGE